MVNNIYINPKAFYKRRYFIKIIKKGLIINCSNNLCIDVEGGTIFSNQVILYEPHGGTNQQ
jgi:hypothetical protein